MLLENMTSTTGKREFNNLLFSAKRVALAEKLEHEAGHTPLDLSYKEPARLDELLNCSRAQLNGKYGDLKYIPTSIRSRPYYNYDEGRDFTLLNAVRNRFVEVSGLMIPNRELPKNNGAITSLHPLIPYGVIR